MSHDFQAIAEASCPHIPALVRRWLPEGQRQGREWVARNPRRDDANPGSFSVNLDTGAWADFALDGAKGGDLTSLAAFLFDLQQSEAANALAYALGMSVDPGAIPGHLAEAFRPVEPTEEVGRDDGASTFMPADTPPPASFLASRHGRAPDATWNYHDAAGRVVLCVCRWNEAKGKRISQASPWKGQGGNLQWKWAGMTGMRPLLGLPDLLARADAPVLIVEGEKAADAARSILPDGWGSTTWAGGSQAVGKADLSPLEGRSVVIWPDADDPGQDAAEALETALPQARRIPRAALQAWRVQAGAVGPMPQGWDAADAVGEGMTRADLTKLLGNNCAESLHVVDVADLIANHPTMKPPIIDGLIRQGETVNVIGSSKTGKSWLVHDLAVAIATGRPWQGFPCRRGRVLIVDNELHKETLASRLGKVIAANDLSSEDLRDRIKTVALRGKLSGLDSLSKQLATMTPGQWDVVVIDALYRAFPEKMDENSNADMAALFNLVDRTAATMGAAFVLIHHASKGNQAGKGITDVGAGAGALSRAADTHIVLRPHADKGQVVMDAVTRSFPGPAPRVLRWDDGRWVHEPDADPTQLAGSGKESSTNGPGIGVLLGMLKDEPTTVAALRAKAKAKRIPWQQVEDALAEEEAEGRAFSWQEDRKRVWARKPKPTKPPTKTDAIRAYAKAHPDAKTKEISDHFGVSDSHVRYALKAPSV